MTGSEDAARQLGRAHVVAKVTGGVVHTFNNIFAVLLGRVELLLGQVDAGRLDPAQLRRGLLSVQKVTRDAAELLGRLRDLTQPPSDEPGGLVDLDVTVREAIEFVQPHVDAVAHTLGVSLRLAPRPPSAPVLVSGQPSALRELLVSLLVNAVEAMPAGGEIAVETESCPGQAILRVVVAGAWTPREGASGLAAARELVGHLGGTIATQSEPGDGSAVTVTLPGAEDATGVLSAPLLPPGLSVLVVEDEPALGDMLREFLESRGCRVGVAASGSAALAELAQREWDVVLADLFLPGVSGWDIARAAKDRSARTAVVLLSGTLIPEDLCADGQTVDVALAKPVDLGRLGRVIAEVVRRPGQRAG